jgi:hypothetical protein
LVTVEHPASNSITVEDRAVFFLTFEVTPKPSHPRYGELDGAFISGWSTEPTASLAEVAARSAAEENGWHFVELDEVRLVTREEFVGDQERLGLFDQASLNGLVLEIHTWPVGADE